MSLVIVTKAASLPVTLTEFKAHLKIDDDATNEDTILTAYLTASTKIVQERQWRQLITAEYELRLDSFGHGTAMIELPKPPLQSIDSIKYIDPDGNEQTLDSSKYSVTVISDNDYGRVYPSFSNVWPSIRNEVHAVRITFTAGYGTSLKVPDETKAAIKILGAHLYENREDIVVGQTISKIPTNLGLGSLIKLHSLGRF